MTYAWAGCQKTDGKLRIVRAISTTSRIVLGLASITLSATILAGTIGLIPDRLHAVLDGRCRMCESTAIGFTLLEGPDHVARFQAGLEAVVRRDPEILSAGIRSPDGELVAFVGDHHKSWNDPATKDLPGAQIFVPIMQDGEPWGTLEFCFQPLTTGWWHNLWVAQGLRLPVFLCITCGLTYWFYLRRVLRYLDPSKVVPGRVRQALDALGEGLLLLDKDERIVLANRAFTTTAGVEERQLLGRRASTLPWNSPSAGDGASELPWLQVLRGEPSPNGSMLNLAPTADEVRTFMVNAAPIRDDRGNSQGALTSFSDVTPLERKKAELNKMLVLLQSSSEEIRRQNEQLERLATEDALTGCKNRRSLLAAFESAWDAAKKNRSTLSCVMVDIDHFKSVNDRFGHSTGDEVLRQVGATLRQSVRPDDFVSRYGGEEFCVLMRDTEITTTMQVAERLRQAVASLQIPNLTVTASFGASSLEFHAENLQELLDQADKALYAAKKGGRNRVVRFDEVPADLTKDHARTTRERSNQDTSEEEPISFHAVAALLSALAFRDMSTAEHSRRVADLCVQVARGLMSPSQCFLLETAALLHDIGKIGVPDAVLLKAGKLTPDELELMQIHERRGLELVRTSFKSPELSAILDHRGAPPDALIPNPKGGRPTRVPLGSRILAIADSFDSMTTNHVYREALTVEEAFSELRRYAGQQFDAELVERFIVTVRSHRSEPVMVGPVSKEAALAIGQQMEQLVLALDHRDLTGMRDIAHHMHLQATKQGADTIARHAGELATALSSEQTDLLAVLHTADELLQLCRQTQRSFFDSLNLGKPERAREKQPC